MLPKKPGPLDTTSLAGMYDPDELIGWIERHLYSPAETDGLLPLCVTPGNCEFVLRTIATRLGIRYLRSLQKHIELVADDSLERNKDYPAYRHYVRNGSVDPRYSDGVRVLKKYIEDNKYLESCFDTSFFRRMYNPEKLIGWLKRLDYLPAQTERLIPLCVTEDNCDRVARMVHERLGPEHLDLLDTMARWPPDYNVLRLDKDLPASQHYNIDGEVDPKFISGIENIRKYIKNNGSLFRCL